MGSVSRSVSVYVLAFDGAHCTYPQRDGQAELTWVVGHTVRWLPTCQQSAIQVITRRWLTPTKYVSN